MDEHFSTFNKLFLYSSSSVALGSLCFRGLKRDLKWFSSVVVTIQALNRISSFLIVGHCNKSISFAHILLVVPDDIHFRYSPIQRKQLREFFLCCLRTDVVCVDNVARLRRICD